MRIVTPQEMANIESLAYQEGLSENEFMKRAGEGVAKKAKILLESPYHKQRVLLLCGKGNNGGDAYVAGQQLLHEGIQVKAISSSETTSPLCQKHRKLFQELGGLVYPWNLIEKNLFEEADLVIDGLVGTEISESSSIL